MSAVWRNEIALRLIDLYKHHSLLWDTSNRAYKNKNMKNEAWEIMAKEMNLPRKDIEAKVHTLRSQFIRERKKILSSKFTGKRDEVISTWFAYDALKFLVKKATTTSGKDTLKKPAMNHNDQFSESPNPENTHESVPSMRAPSSPPPTLPSTSSKSSRKRTIPQVEKVEDTYEIMRIKDKIINSSQDRFDVYGQYVASELREVKDEHSLVMAKYYINNILFETRMGKYRVYSNASPGASSQNPTEVDGMSSEHFDIKIEGILDNIESADIP